MYFLLYVVCVLPHLEIRSSLVSEHVISEQICFYFDVITLHLKQLSNCS